MIVGFFRFEYVVFHRLQMRISTDENAPDHVKRVKILVLKSKTKKLDYLNSVRRASAKEVHIFLFYLIYRVLKYCFLFQTFSISRFSRFSFFIVQVFQGLVFPKFSFLRVQAQSLVSGSKSRF